MPGCLFECVSICAFMYKCNLLCWFAANQGELVGVFTLWSCFIHVNEDVLGFPSLQGHTHCRSTLGINYPLHPYCICSEYDHGHSQIRLTSPHLWVSVWVYCNLHIYSKCTSPSRISPAVLSLHLKFMQEITQILPTEHHSVQTEKNNSSFWYLSAFLLRLEHLYHSLLHRIQLHYAIYTTPCLCVNSKISRQLSQFRIKAGLHHHIISNLFNLCNPLPKNNFFF